jgi:hypothetical protein
MDSCYNKKRGKEGNKTLEHPQTLPFLAFTADLEREKGKTHGITARTNASLPDIPIDQQAEGKKALAGVHR